MDDDGRGSDPTSDGPRNRKNAPASRDGGGEGEGRVGDGPGSSGDGSGGSGGADGGDGGADGGDSEWRFTIDDVGPEGVREDESPSIDPERIDPEHAAFVALGIAAAVGLLASVL